MILFRQELVGKTSASPPATVFLRRVLFPPGEAALKVGVFDPLVEPPRPVLCDYMSDASFPDALSVSLFHLLSR